MDKCILAILQNQWFKHPERISELYARWPERRNDLNERFLFHSSLSGKVLRKNLGIDLCKKMIWEEASKEIGSVSSSKFPGDTEHIKEQILKYKPRIVIPFGTVAQSTIYRLARPISQSEETYEVCGNKIHTKRMFTIDSHVFQIIDGPHPASRHRGVVQVWLKGIKTELETLGLS